MRLLALGGDESVSIEGTPAHVRMIEYSHLFEELHIVVASRQARKNVAAGNLFLYPAAGRSLLSRMLRMLWIAERICRTVGPDVISTENADVFGSIGLVLSRRHGIPLQVQVHTDVFSPRYRSASWKERLRYGLAMMVLPRASGVRVVSKRVAQAAAQRLGIPAWRIRVLPIHTDAAAYRSAIRDPTVDARFRDSSFRIVSAGRFVDREKNFSLLLDVATDIRRDIPQAVLVLVGDGPDRRRYERRIKSRGLQGWVQLEPWRHDLPSFLKSFDVFVLASNYEGWPRACVEAAAAGLPVIMTDVGNAGELFVDGASALVVPIGDRRAMAQAVVRLHSNPQERQALARHAQEAVERMPIRSMADYYRAYREAVEACLEC